LRIISGKYRGRHIPVPSKFKARPTTDFARENLFNILANTWEFDGLQVLDLYAGTGSIGFEFTSRGASFTDMVELNGSSARFLRSIVERLNAENITVYRSDAIRYVESCLKKYDIVFADPPYDLEIIPQLPDTVFDSEILEDEGWFILEHGKDNSFRNHPRFLEQRNYGSVRFSIFSKNN
jgi:16S rRNA (guanine(966)-N(2))-methyltransferase RsmD